MTEIRLWNTATKTKVALAPLDPKTVRMYVCGPTVYDRAHIGNARPVVVFDVLYRLLRHKYGADAVTYVRNFTDVDDKINAKAVETGRSIREITDETIGWYLDDMDALGALRPTQMPRCTEFIEPMVAMSLALIERGNAYVAEGHVLFDVTTYDRYGKLSNRALDDMIAGARVEVAPYKRNPMDFVLWKPSTPDQPGWDSPWGRGRPGWHIECSAMAKELLGEHFDIHAGGIDLLFPHHENELAQSNCLHGGEMAQVWMHNGFLEVEGQKMSKSLGNFFTVRDLLDKGVQGYLIRMVFFMTHYRKPMDWTESKYRQAQNELHKWSYWLGNFVTTNLPPSNNLVAVLADDLNTPGALTVLRDHFAVGHYEQLAADLKFLGLWDGQDPGQISLGYVHDSWEKKEVTWAIDDLLRKLDIARNLKNFAEADRIRAGLFDAGIAVKTSPQGTTYDLTPTFDPAKLESLK